MHVKLNKPVQEDMNLLQVLKEYVSEDGCLDSRIVHF